MEYLHNNKRGSILLLTILIMASVFAVTIGVSSLVAPGLAMGRTQTNSTNAYFAAETGAEHTLYAFRISGFDLGSCNLNTGVNHLDLDNNRCVGSIKKYDLTAGSATSSYYVDLTSVSPITLRSLGDYSGTNRVIEISF